VICRKKIIVGFMQDKLLLSLMKRLLEKERFGKGTSR
jgi:hypothetical protein